MLLQVQKERKPIQTYSRGAEGEHHTDLLMNCSSPIRRSSMKVSSKMPSSGRNGSSLFRALPGRFGTTIWERHWSTQAQQRLNTMVQRASAAHISISASWGSSPASLTNHRRSTLTLLSRSSSIFSHSKSLYLLFTQESFNLKIGRFVCRQKHNWPWLNLNSIFFNFLTHLKRIMTEPWRHLGKAEGTKEGFTNLQKQQVAPPPPLLRHLAIHRKGCWNFWV